MHPNTTKVEQQLDAATLEKLSGMATGEPSPSATATPPSLNDTIVGLDRTVVQSLLQQGYRYGTRNFRRAYKKVVDRLEAEANKTLKSRQQGRSFERQIYNGLRQRAEAHQH